MGSAGRHGFQVKRHGPDEIGRRLCSPGRDQRIVENRMADQRVATGPLLRIVRHYAIYELSVLTLVE